MTPLAPLWLQYWTTRLRQYTLNISKPLVAFQVRKSLEVKRGSDKSHLEDCWLATVFAWMRATFPPLMGGILEKDRRELGFTRRRRVALPSLDGFPYGIGDVGLLLFLSDLTASGECDGETAQGEQDIGGGFGDLTCPDALAGRGVPRPAVNHSRITRILVFTNRQVNPPVVDFPAHIEGDSHVPALSVARPLLRARPSTPLFIDVQPLPKSIVTRIPFEW